MFTNNIESITISNDIMFSLVMQNESLCKEFIETILHIKLSKIIYKDTQVTKKSYIDTKGVRLDAYVESDGSIFEIEMQTSHYEGILYRARYYEAIIDNTNLGEGCDYRALKDLVVIFICTNDPFGKGLPVYTLKRACKECDTLDLSNGVHEIYLNCAAYEKVCDKELRALLQYIANQDVLSAFTKRLDDFVLNKRQDGEVQVMINKLQLSLYDARYDGRLEGRQEGLKIGVLQGQKEGRKEGRLEGRKEGRLEGRKEAEKEYSTIIAKLQEEIKNLKNNQSGDGNYDK